MRDRFKKLVSFSFNFTYTSLQDTVLEKKCLLVFLLITNSKKYLVAMRDRCKKISFCHSILPTIRFKAQYQRRNVLLFC